MNDWERISREVGRVERDQWCGIGGFGAGRGFNLLIDFLFFFCLFGSLGIKHVSLMQLILVIH